MLTLSNNLIKLNFFKSLNDQRIYTNSEVSDSNNHALSNQSKKFNINSTRIE